MSEKVYSQTNVSRSSVSWTIFSNTVLCCEVQKSVAIYSGESVVRDIGEIGAFHSRLVFVVGFSRMSDFHSGALVPIKQFQISCRIKLHYLHSENLSE